MWKTNLTQFLTVAFVAGVLFTGNAFAQVCPNLTATLSGAYGYVATQTASGTPGTKTGFSNTEVGVLLSGIANSTSFAAAGQWTLDGAGNIFATSSTGLSIMVGTYTVNSDCTVVATLTDAFVTTKTAANQTPANLQGLVLSGGAEVDLVLVPTSTQPAPSLLIKLVRPLYPSGCTVANLTGTYGLVTRITFQAVAVTPPGTGSTTITFPAAPVNPPGTGNISTLARVHFDGGGNVIADTITSGSPLGSFQLTGTYTVNSDCSGTMTVTNVATATSTTTFVLNFVLTQPHVAVSLGTPSLSANQLRPGIEFGLSNAMQTATGYGKAQ